MSESKDCCEQTTLLICAPSQALPQPIEDLDSASVLAPDCADKWGKNKTLKDALSYLCQQADSPGGGTDDGLLVPKGTVGIPFSTGTEVIVEPCIAPNLICKGLEGQVIQSSATANTHRSPAWHHFYLTGIQSLLLNRQGLDLTSAFASGESLGSLESNGTKFVFTRKARILVDCGAQIRVQSSAALSSANRIIVSLALGVERLSPASAISPPGQEYRIFEIDRPADGQPHVSMARSSLSLLVLPGDKVELRAIITTNPTTLTGATVTATSTPDGGGGLSIAELVGF
jgi:hypothetical protein